jgi:hypothetical protein
MKQTNGYNYPDEFSTSVRILGLHTIGHNYFTLKGVYEKVEALHDTILFFPEVAILPTLLGVISPKASHTLQPLLI